MLQSEPGMQGYTQKLAWDLFAYLGFVSINFMAAINMMILKWVQKRQEPIKWSLHLPYKPLESTLSRVDL